MRNFFLTLPVLLLMPAPGCFPVFSSEPPGLMDRYGDPLPEGAVMRLGTTRLRHRSSLTGVAFSPDGKVLASCGWDEAIRLWDVATGKRVGEMADPLHQVGTFAVAFSPDGGKLAAVCERGLVRLWDVKTQKKLFDKKGHGDRVYGVAFSPDGITFASASGDVRLWDAATGNELMNFQAQGARDTHAVAFSPDGKLLASGAGRTIHVWNIDKGDKPITISRAHGQDIVSIAFLPDSRALVSAGHSYVPVKLKDGRPAVEAVSSIRFWDATTGKMTKELKFENSKGASSIAVTSNGKFLASAHQDRIQIWDLTAEKAVVQIGNYRNTYGQRAHGIAISQDGKNVAAIAGDHAVRLWDATNGRPLLESAESHHERLEAVAYSPDGKLIVTGSNDGAIGIWDAQAATHQRKLLLVASGAGYVHDVSISPDGRILAALGDVNAPFDFHGVVKLWNFATGKELLERQLPGRAGGLAFSRDGKILAVSSYRFDDDGIPFSAKDNLIHFFDPSTGKEIAKLTGHKAKVASLAFLPDGKTLASAAEDNTIRFWDVASASQRSEFVMKLKGQLNSAAFSPDGTVVIVNAMFEPDLLVYEMPGGKELRRFHIDNSFGSKLATNGRFLGSGGVDITSASKAVDYGVRLWDLNAGNEVLKFKPGILGVSSLAFSPDGRRVISGMGNGTALIWDISSAVSK